MSSVLKFAAPLLFGLLSFFTPRQPTPASPPLAAYTPQAAIISHGPRDKKLVALTFDADMTPKMKKDLETGKVTSWYDKRITDTLEGNKVPATLFLTGMWIELYPKETAELARDPLFELGNHSYSHPAFGKRCVPLKLVSQEDEEAEITKTQKLLKDVAGIDNHLFRFPGGCYDSYALEQVHKLGLDAVGWDVSSTDAFNPDKNIIVANVLNHTQNGSIIVMHLMGNRNAPQTANALPLIISGLKSRGFSFVKVSELLQ